MAKNLKCRYCGKDGFPSPNHIRQHYIDEGHPIDKPGVVAPGPMTETALLSRCSEHFDAASLDDDGRKRVLDYLFARYYPATEEVEENEAA